MKIHDFAVLVNPTDPLKESNLSFILSLDGQAIHELNILRTQNGCPDWKEFFWFALQLVKEHTLPPIFIKTDCWGCADKDVDGLEPEDVDKDVLCSLCLGSQIIWANELCETCGGSGAVYIRGREKTRTKCDCVPENEPPKIIKEEIIIKSKEKSKEKPKPFIKRGKSFAQIFLDKKNKKL